MPAVAFASAAGSRRSPTDTATPACCNANVAGPSARTSADTLSPPATSARARWPPVKPVAPVTKTGLAAIEYPGRGQVANARTVLRRAPFGDDRDRRPESFQEPQPIEHVFDLEGEPTGADDSVKRDRQDELPMDRPYTKPRSIERLPDRAVRDDAVGLGAHAKRVHGAARQRFEQCDARRRRIVEDHEPFGDAAELGHALPPVGRVHQQPQAEHAVELAGRH